MKTINEITDDVLIFDEQGEFRLYGYDLKSEWNSLSVADRSGFRISKERVKKCLWNLCWIGYMTIWKMMDTKK